VKSLHWMPEVSTLIANTENLHIDEDGCGRNYQYSQQDVHRKVSYCSQCSASVLLVLYSCVCNQ
jgi:hypothetical protein